MVLGSPLGAAAADLVGQVVGVKDGDTLVMQVNGADIAVRLAEIDAPEGKQAFGHRARHALEQLALGRQARAIPQTTDRYGRTVARVYLGAVDVSQAMVRLGYAWVFDKYVTDKSLYPLQDEARAARRGLWNDPHAIPPWDYRAQSKSGTLTALPVPAVAPAVNPSFQCGAKRFCREMVSCEEAKFHLTQCGVTQLDGDGDGVPCAQLCKVSARRRGL